MSDIFTLAGKEFRSRLIIGTGKYRSFDEMKAAHRASGAEMVTVAVRRVNLDRSSESLLDFIDPRRYFLLPNTAGCYTADDAIRRRAVSCHSVGPALGGDRQQSPRSSAGRGCDPRFNRAIANPIGKPARQRQKFPSLN